MEGKEICQDAYSWLTCRKQCKAVENMSDSEAIRCYRAAFCQEYQGLERLRVVWEVRLSCYLTRSILVGTCSKSLDGTGHNLVHTHHLECEGIGCSSVWVGLDTMESVFSSS